MSRSFILLFCGIFIPWQASVFATLQVSGKVSYAVFDKSGERRQLANRTFRATFDGCRWRIRTEVEPGSFGSSNSPFVYMEIANGADSLFVTREFDENKLPPADSPVMTKSVTVSWGKTPYVDPEQLTGAIWFPYAWECELGTITNSLMRDDITFPFSVRYLSNSAAPVIQEVVIRNEGFWHVISPEGKASHRPAKAPYSAGFVQSKFTALEFTNVAELVVPRRSQIQYFMTKAGAITNTDTRLLGQVDVVASSITVTNFFLAPPELVKPPAMIYDKRLRRLGEEDFSYLSKGLVYETNSPEVERIYRKFDEIEILKAQAAEKARAKEK